MTLTFTTHVRRETDSGEYAEPVEVIAIVNGDNVTILEPADYRGLPRDEQRQLFDAACNEAERQERAQGLVEELRAIGLVAGGAA